MKIYDIPGARKRRYKLLASTSRNSSIEKRYRQALNKCNYVYKNSNNPLIRLRASTDAKYFKRKLERT